MSEGVVESTGGSPAPIPKLGSMMPLADNVNIGNPSGPLSNALQWELRRIAVGSFGSMALVLTAVTVALAASYVQGQQNSASFRNQISIIIFGVASGSFSLYFLGLLLWHLIGLQRDFAAGEVRKADGSVSFRGSTLEATFLGQRWWAVKRLQVPPGPYRIYFLPNSGYLLALQPILTGEPHAAIAIVTEDDSSTSAAEPDEPSELPSTNEGTGFLGTILNFDQDDLRENRAGRQSKRQTMRLRRGFIVGVCIGLAMTCGAVWILSRAPLFVQLILGLIALGGWSSLYPMLREAQSREVRRLEGIVTMHLEEGRDGKVYHYFVAGEPLRARAEVFDVIEAGQYYRIYLTSQTNQILSLERLDTPVP